MYVLIVTLPLRIVDAMNKDIIIRLWTCLMQMRVPETGQYHTAHVSSSNGF